MDVESYQRWWDYTAAYERMIRATDTKHARWYQVRADSKKKARLNCIKHLLSCIDYEHITYDPPDLGERKKRPKGVVKEVQFNHQVLECF